jgi:hypothetical protein
LPLGPANAVTDCSIKVCMTCNPAPTDSASRPSVAEWAISASATVTSSGMVSPSVLASTSLVWYCLPMAVPFLVVFLADHPDLPLGRAQVGDRHLNFYELRDNLRYGRPLQVIDDAGP